MSKKFQTVTFKLLDIIVILTMVLSSPMSVFAAPLADDPNPVLSADKSDYAPGESAHITGTGFAPGSYSLAALGPDSVVVDWGTVSADNDGNLTTYSPALSSAGSYVVSALAVSDNALAATVTFTVTEPPAPTDTPTEEPTATEPPTEEPTQEPTGTELPTEEPTATQAPTEEPTEEPTATEPPTTTSEPTETPTSSGPPTIVSDHPDYSPGSQVVLTGTNWQGDLEVRIIVNDDVGQTWRRDVSVSVATDGTVQDIFNLPSHFVANYSVTVRGLQTDRVATTTFTDAQEDYKHYADKSPASWQNGALQGSNSQYFEGEVVPHYWKTEGLTPGSFYAFNIYYDYYDPSSGGFCGFDFMAQYNLSRTPPTV